MGVAAGARAPAVIAAVEADARFYADAGREAAVSVSAGGGAGGVGGARPDQAIVRICIDADELPHLRAGVGSTLRLVQAAYESIGAASAPEGAGASKGRGGRAAATGRGRERPGGRRR